MLRTCKATEIPPNPSKNAQIIILVEMFLLAISAISQTPFVSSISPVIIPFRYLLEILKTLDSGEIRLTNKFNIPLLFNIEITTEKSTTNPPIRNIVLIEFIMELARISPKFDKDIFDGNLFEFTCKKEDLLFLLTFHHLNKIPTVIQASICVIRSKIPVLVSLKSPIPTVPTINKGPELFVKAISLSASIFVQRPCFLKSDTIFAPTG